MNRRFTARSRPARLLAVVSALALVLAACTTTPIPLPKHRRVHPTGRILGILAGSRPGLLEYAFSSRRLRMILLSEPPQGAFFSGTPASEFVVLLGAGGESRLFEITSGGQARPVSPALSVPVRPAAPAADDHVLLASCEGQQPIFVASLRASDASTPPTEAARGCPAALSPDGRLVAFSPDLVSVWTTASSGRGPSMPVVRLAGRKLLLSLGMLSPRIVPAAGMSWSPAGLAVAVEGEGRFACVVVEPSGRVRVIPLGAARPTALVWSPTAKLLAFTEHDRTGDALRTFDPTSHRLRLAALALGKQLRGLVWSPTGDAIVTLEGIDHWLVVTPDGAKVRSIAVPPGSAPADWTP